MNEDQNLIRPTNENSLLEISKKLKVNTSIFKIIEKLHEENTFLYDVMWKKANSGDSEEIKILDGYRKIGGNILTFSKSIFLKSDIKKFDYDFIDAPPSPFEDIGNRIIYEIFYGDHGISQYYDRLDNIYTEGMIIDAGGTGRDLRDIWMLGWGLNLDTIYMFYPDVTDQTLGFDIKKEPNEEVVKDNHIDKGVFHLSFGIALEDLESVVRICNIDRDRVEDGKTDIFGMIHSGITKLNLIQKPNLRNVIYSDIGTSELVVSDLVRKNIYGNRNVRTIENTPWHCIDSLDRDMLQIK